ncbi:hypothetical protein P5V15_001144 [Pogonomyrmex californicus]
MNLEKSFERRHKCVTAEIATSLSKDRRNALPREHCEQLRKVYQQIPQFADRTRRDIDQSISRDQSMQPIGMPIGHRSDYITGYTRRSRQSQE